MGTRRLINLTCLLIGASVNAASPRARAEGWVNARIPIAAHLGAPENGVESGLHVDLLAVFPIGGTATSDLEAERHYRLGIGPTFELRTLDLDRLGAGAGLEILGLLPSDARRVTLGLAAEAGVSKWVAGSNADWSTHASLAIQLRAGGRPDRIAFVHTTALYVRADRSAAGDWSLVTGIELGGDPLSWLALTSGWEF